MLKDTTTPLLLKKEASSQRSFLQCLYEINPDLFAALLAVGLDIFSRVDRVDIECDNGKGARQLTLFLVLLPADYVLCATRNFLLNYGNKKVKKSVDSVEHFIEFSAVLLAITDLMSYKGQVLPFGRSDCAKQLVSFVQIYSATFLLNIPFWLSERSKKKIEELEKIKGDSSLQDVLNCSPGRSVSLNNSNPYSKRGRSQSFRKIGHNFLIAAYKAQSIVSHLFILAIIFKDMVIVSESVETSQHLNKTTLEDRIVKEFPFYKGISFQNYLLFWFVLSLPYFPMVHWELSCGEVFKKIEDLKPVSIKEMYVKSVIHRLLHFLTLVAFSFSFCVLGLVIFCEELNIQEISPEDDHIFFGVTLTALTAAIGMYRVGQWYSEAHKSEGERKDKCCAKGAEDGDTELDSIGARGP